MKLTVVDPANRDGELIAYAASHGTRLRKSEVVRVRWHSAANQASLTQHEFSMVLITEPNGLAQRTNCTPVGPLCDSRDGLLARGGIAKGCG